MRSAPVISRSVREGVQPAAGVDYPGTWQAFEAWFVDDEACRDYLERLRWSNGFECPLCRGREAWRTGRGLWMCRSCGRQTSVTAGTVFHRSRLPLRTWFAAIWFVCAQKNGVSALGLQRVLGFGSYSTAWTWMHKLRRAMVRPDRDQLGGPGATVEVDTTFVGGRSRTGKDGPRYFNKGEVVIAVERRHPRGLGRARLARIDSTDRKDAVWRFLTTNIAPGSVVYTDGDRLFQGIDAELGVTHERILIHERTNLAHTLLPAVHRVAALLKRWLAGTLHDGQSVAHLDYYLDEFTFRFNRRTSRARGLLFYRLLQQAVGTDPHPYSDLIARPSR
jgi:transposase-like protein